MSIKPEIKQLSDSILKSLTVDNKEGTINASETVFKDNIPSDLTIETFEKVAEHNTNFVAASAHAFGSVALEMMKKNKTVDQVTTAFPMTGKDEVTHTLHKSKEFSVNGNTTTVYGHVSTTLEQQTGKNVGSYKAVRNEIKEVFKTAFNK